MCMTKSVTKCQKGECTYVCKCVGRLPEVAFWPFTLKIPCFVPKATKQNYPPWRCEDIKTRLKSHCFISLSRAPPPIDIIFWSQTWIVTNLIFISWNNFIGRSMQLQVYGNPEINVPLTKMLLQYTPSLPQTKYPLFWSLANFSWVRKS